MPLKKYLVHLDLNKNQLQNAVLQPLATAPTSPKEGQLYYNTNDDTVYVNTSIDPAVPVWLDLGKQGTSYTHPTVANGALAPVLTGAQVLATFETNAEGHVLAATTRTLTLADLGYTPYAHPIGANTAIDTTGLQVVDQLTVDAEGHVTVASTRTITATELAAVIISDAATTSTIHTWSIDQIKNFVAGQVTAGMTYQGGYDASINAPDLDTTPVPIGMGDTYTVTAAGTFFGASVEVGDVLIAEIDNPTTEAGWTIVNKNIDIVPASETAAGIIEIADAAEVTAGQDDTRAVTPLKLQTKLDDALSDYLVQNITSNDNSVVIDSTTISGTFDLSVPTQSMDRFGVTGEDDSGTTARAFTLNSTTSAPVKFAFNNTAFEVRNDDTDYLQYLSINHGTGIELYHSWKATNDFSSIKALNSSVSMVYYDTDTNTNHSVVVNSGGIGFENGVNSPYVYIPNNKSGYLALSVDGITADSEGNISLGAITSETDPVFTAHVVSGITQTDIDNWNTAHGWGNHADAGYVQSVTGTAVDNTDPLNPVINLPATTIGKYSAAVAGDGAATSIVVTHNLGSLDVSVKLREIASPYTEVECAVAHTSTNSITLGFNVAPVANEYQVTVIG